MPEGPIDTAYVEIEPEFARFREEMIRGIDRAFAALRPRVVRAAETIEKEFEEAADEANESLRDIGGPEAFAPAVASAKVAAESIEEAFDDVEVEFRKNFDAINRDIEASMVSINRDVNRSFDVISRVSRELDRAFKEVDIDVDVDRFRTRFLRQMSSIGGTAVVSLGLAMQGAILRDPRIAGAIGAALLATLPVIGAALSAGIVLALGSALAGLGIAFAAQANEVKDVFTSLKTSLVADMRELADPFEDTLTRIAGFIRRTFVAFRSTFRVAFLELAPIVTTFADAFFTALEQFRPAISAIGDAFGELLTRLGPKLGPLFADFADSLVGIATTVSENAETFAQLITFFLDAADAAVEFIGTLASLYTQLKQIADAAFFVLVPSALGKTDEAMKGTGATLETFGFQADAAARLVGNYAIQLQNATQSLTDYAAAQLAATDPVFGLLNAVTQADDAQTAYNDAVKEFGVDSPQAANAAIAAAQAVQGLEQAALNGELSFASFEQKLGEWVAAGAITAAQADTIRARVRGARGEAENFQGSYAAEISVRDRATAALQNIREWLRQIQSKTITITARSQIPAGVSLRQLMERQHGGPVAAGQPYVVGERGRELFIPDVPGVIIPNNKIDPSIVLGFDNGRGVLPPGMSVVYNGTGSPEEMVRVDRGAAGRSGEVRLHPDSLRVLARILTEEMITAIGASNYATARRAELYARAG